MSAHWRQRAKSELGAREAFIYLRDALEREGADAAVVALAEKAVADEAAHAEICRGLAEHYGGEPVAVPAAPELVVPVHDGVPRPFWLALDVAAMCCINETLACAFLELCLAESDDPMIERIHRAHLADEIDHARIGWAYFGSARCDSEKKRAVSDHLAPVLRVNVARWHERVATLPKTSLRGVPSTASAARAIDAAVADLVLPGFAHVGIDTAGLGDVVAVR